jgi:hypothetical protein
MSTISIKGPFGWLSQQPDGSLQAREQVGPWEQFEVIGLEPPAPQPEPEPEPGPPAATEQDQFMRWVYGKPFGQQTLLNLEPTLNAAGWKLTKANAAGDRTKVLPPSGVWVRVGFGEGYWVWIPQS